MFSVLSTSILNQTWPPLVSFNFLFSIEKSFWSKFIDVRNDPNGASTCNPKECQLPDCWCSEDGTEIPGNLTASTVPQMITITFDDAVNAENFELYSSKKAWPYFIECVPWLEKGGHLSLLIWLLEIFSSDRKNPNGCPVRGTFYVSHQYTNYRDVQFLWNIGHEIAAHSVT